MKVICTRCGSTKIKYRTWITPNEQETEKALIYSVKLSFKLGYCYVCKKESRLTDPEKTRKKIEKKYSAYKKRFGEEPGAAWCKIIYCSPRNGTDKVLIKISGDKNGSKDYFPFCENINALKYLCEKTHENFLVTDIYCFE